MKETNKIKEKGKEDDSLREMKNLKEWRKERRETYKGKQ